ncbi:MAG: ATP cone domain-containing protein [Clostridium sp.]
MKVIKKDGRLQEFNANKVKLSLEYAGDTAAIELNESDLKILVEDIERTLIQTRGEDGNTSSYEIVGTIIKVLKEDRFTAVINAFVNYKK